MDKYKITAMDFMGALTDPEVKPTLETCNFTPEEIAAGKFVYSLINNCWSLEREVIGTIQDEWFIPDPGQSVRYKINVRGRAMAQHFVKI